jgi:hypothetical protein
MSSIADGEKLCLFSLFLMKTNVLRLCHYSNVYIINISLLIMRRRRCKETLKINDWKNYSYGKIEYEWEDDASALRFVLIMQERESTSTIDKEALAKKS